jgi:hypothetical protein
MYFYILYHTKSYCILKQLTTLSVDAEPAAAPSQD